MAPETIKRKCYGRKVDVYSFGLILWEMVTGTIPDLLVYDEAVEVAQIMDEVLDAQDNHLLLKCIKIDESHVYTILPTQCSTSEYSDGFNLLNEC
ncbi:hypothetical protein K1719_011517 [Acacia pycnantha]|nr:hypothetical protein K1719_011517 [Acacia pycnantha]